MLTALVFRSLLVVSLAGILSGCDANTGTTQLSEMPADTPPSTDPADQPNQVAGSEF